jgi:hypothetical protein
MQAKRHPLRYVGFVFFLCAFSIYPVSRSLRRITKGPLFVPKCASVLQGLVDSKPAAVWPPPCPLSPSFRAAFEGPDGSMPITKDWCLAQRYEGAGERVLDWNAGFVDDYCAKIASGEEVGSYQDHDRRELMHAMAVLAEKTTGSPSFAGTEGMVMGSERPCVCVACNNTRRRAPRSPPPPLRTHTPACTSLPPLSTGG